MSGDGPRVLVVDDEPQILRGLKVVQDLGLVVDDEHPRSISAPWDILGCLVSGKLTAERGRARTARTARRSDHRCTSTKPRQIARGPRCRALPPTEERLEHIARHGLCGIDRPRLVTDGARTPSNRQCSTVSTGAPSPENLIAFSIRFGEDPLELSRSARTRGTSGTRNSTGCPRAATARRPDRARRPRRKITPIGLGNERTRLDPRQVERLTIRSGARPPRRAPTGALPR